MSMVVDPKNEIMLAYHMNGEEFPTEHGFPLRLIVPGVVGVRNAKWVSSLTISDEEATSTQQKENYKIITQKDAKKIDYSKIQPIMGYVVNSAIADPIHQETIEVPRNQPFITIRGYAVGNQAKGTPVHKVELSFDSGQTWTRTSITQREEKEPGDKVFSWVLWEHTIDVRTFLAQGNQTHGTVRATCKCTDSEGTTQDKTIEQILNVKGLLNNSPHTIQFNFTIKE